MEKQWKAIEPGVWRPTPEKPSIEGVLVNTEPKNEQANYSARYYLENQEGMFLVWGCAILDDRMRYVKIGQEVRITFKGQTRNQKGQKVNLYEVEVAESSTSAKEDEAGNAGSPDQAHSQEVVVEKI